MTAIDPRTLLIPARAALIVLGVPVVVSAQAGQAPVATPSMSFAGAGVGVTPTDVSGRVTRTASSEADVTSLRLEIGFAPSRRVGAGAAYIPFRESNGDHNLVGRLPITDRHREQAWLAELRVRTLATSRSAVDVVAGAGVLRQQREGAYTVCGLAGPCTTIENPEASRSSPVFSVGADIPYRIAPHVALAAVARVLWMRRGRLDVQTWPRDSSTELSAVVSLRLTP